MNSFNLTLSEKHFICPSILNDSFAGQSNLGCRSKAITLDTSCQSLLACKVSFGKSADGLLGTPLQVTLCFSLAAFKFLSSSLTFGTLIMMSWCVPLWVQLLGLFVLLGLVCVFPLPNQGTFLSLSFQISFRFFAVPLLFLALL